ncbi:redoxin family protein [Saccharicrinis sp. FJH54]|uniref:redoxin family protein n=1 Tax=Saccharicrinis sp. FJH54 TaxID=3344665 RepID=UPI0035D4017C
MKTKTLFLMLLFVSHIINGQIPEHALSFEEEAFNAYFFNKDVPVVKGKVLNAGPEELKDWTINYSIVTPFYELQTAKTSQLNPDGTFELELDYAFPNQQVWFRIDPLIYASLYVNTDLYIELDVRLIKEKGMVRFNGEGVRFLGSDGELTSYMNNHVIYQRRQQLNVQSKLRKKNLESGYDSVFLELEAIDDNYIKENPSEYAWLVKNERQSEYYKGVLRQSRGQKIDEEVWKQLNQHRPCLMSNNGMSFYNNLGLYITSFPHRVDFTGFEKYSKLTPDQKLLIDSAIELKTKNDQLDNPDWLPYGTLVRKALKFLGDTMEISREVNRAFLYDSLYSKPKSDLLKLRISSKDPKQHKVLLEFLLQNMQTEWCKNVVQKDYDMTVANVEKINDYLNKGKELESDATIGTPIKTFPWGADLYSTDKIKADQLLQNISAKFKGKSLIIDIWATWCDPCIREMPLSTQLHNEMKDMPVEFIYICTTRSSNIEKWKSKIAEYQLSGTHIFLDAGIVQDLLNLFSASGYPTYAFIDPKGKYIPGFNVRPSSVNKEELKKLVMVAGELNN